MRWTGSRKWALGILTLLLGASALLLGSFRYGAGEGTPLTADRAPLLVPSAITLVPGVHLLGGLNPSVAYVVETSEGLVLVDSGLQSDATLLKSEMAELGLDGCALRAILITHAHADHTGGAQHLREETGARIYAGKGDTTVLRAGGPREALFSTFHMPHETLHATTVDVELEGGESIVFGNVRFQALATPGHTPGSTCYLMERGAVRALFAGDVVTMLLGRDDPLKRVGKPLGTYSAYLAPRYRGNAADYLASLRKLRALPVPDLVLPGHPGADPTPQSPRLSHERWEEILDGGIHEMENLVARQQRDGPDFLDGEPKLLLPDLYYLGDFQGSAVYGFFASSKFFLVCDRAGGGLVEFMNTRLRELGLEPAEPTAVLLTSSEAGETPGLEELVKQSHATVVSPARPQSLRTAFAAGKVVLGAEELPAQGWFKVTTIPLSGRRLRAVAYHMTWAGKTVLFSGRIPTKLNPQSVDSLINSIKKSRADVRDYSASLSHLAGLPPDLWLPAAPIDGQNANLYAGEWQRVIEENLEVTNFILSRARVD
jgi:glyoxylase-like metal-dependent hydrolase (beta-lactamase superfamily II)